MTECEGACRRSGECKNPIVRVHVEHDGKDWGYFWYCQTAIYCDRKAGMVVSRLGPAPEDEDRSGMCGFDGHRLDEDDYPAA